MSARARILEILREIEEIDRRIRELEEEASRLRPLKGSVVRKWVLNKQRNRYYYWYYVYKERGKTRSTYLGAKLPDWVKQRLEDRRRMKEIQLELINLNARRKALKDELAALVLKI